MSEPPRRSKRAHPAAEPDLLNAAQDADEEAAEDEEEVTRCLCGQQEYPGPPLSEAYGASEAQADDAGGLFIQCDGCSVWQHGGCVGIFDEAQSPDKYYCEECRPKHHEVHVDSRGYVVSTLHRSAWHSTLLDQSCGTFQCQLQAASGGHMSWHRVCLT